MTKNKIERKWVVIESFDIDDYTSISKGQILTWDEIKELDFDDVEDFIEYFEEVKDFGLFLKYEEDFDADGFECGTGYLVTTLNGSVQDRYEVEEETWNDLRYAGIKEYKYGQ